MARNYQIFIWKKAPFLRLLLPFICGIILQHKIGFSLGSILSLVLLFGSLFLFFRLFKEFYKFKTSMLRGIILSGLLAALGMWITFQKDIRNHQNWYGNKYDPGANLVVLLIEPPVEKAKSYKALVRIETMSVKHSAQKVLGEIIVYFSKDSLSEKLKYGDYILLNKPLQRIRNSGNPGEFDYEQYLAFQQVFHQVYLKQNEWIHLKGNKKSFIKNALFNTREYVISTIDNYITGANESGLAKALLIGYRIDLEKDLVQAYSNAGVVHLIAISGLHIALIYGLLLWVALRIPILKNSTVTRTLTLILCLWFFAFLTGAPPSVMRATVMFSFVSAASLFKRKASIYNSLSISAFVLLCVDPYVLWDVGFQLSYLAVLGIVVLQKPVYNWMYFKNKILNYIWEMASVSISAQIFTIPICFYYFHQLPLLFLIANIIAIPLATVALWGLIALVAISPLPIITVYFGKIVSVFLWLMNHSVLLINRIPFVLWENVYLPLWPTLFLYAVFISFIYWLIRKNMAALKSTLAFTLILTSMIVYQKWQNFNQRKIIVYNIPSQNAVDFIYGNRFRIISDPELQNNKLLHNFHLKPSRVLLQANKSDYKNDVFFSSSNFYKFFDKRMIIIDTIIRYYPIEKMSVDFIILTNNPKVKIADIIPYYDCKQFIFSASNPMWKIGEWKKECEELFLRSHSVAEQGAFVLSF